MRKKEIIIIKTAGLITLMSLAIFMLKIPARASSVDPVIPTDQREQIAAVTILKPGKMFESNSFQYEITTSNESKKTGTVMLLGMTAAKQEVIIPETEEGPDGYTYTVTQIAEKCFYGNTKITSVYIPKTIRNIRACAFSGCKNLKKIEVDKYNLHYKTKNNVLYTKDGSKLVAILYAGLSYTPPSTVTSIESGAFVYCKDLENITIPKSLKKMGMIFDNSCPNLKKVTFKSPFPPEIEKCIRVKDGRMTQLLCNIDIYHVGLRILVPVGSEASYREGLAQIFRSRKALPVVPYKK